MGTGASTSPSTSPKSGAKPAEPASKPAVTPQSSRLFVGANWKCSLDTRHI
eukprot:s1230_g1.t1